jgi:hypothetical protein|tara:strand:+ start:565 stop:867 length:303 start_codon:yes stop_codon:yes gene_type:complete
MAKYKSTSPWAETEIRNEQYLDFMQKRFIPENPDDILYEIKPQYTYRPDLLAFDLYGTSKLWWVFTMRNIEVLKDPVFDFVAGTQIYLPKQSILTAMLGV